MKQRVISFHYILTSPEGEKIDSSEGNEPLTFLEGIGQIIPGLEKELGKMKVGDKKKVKIQAADAYGPINKEKLFQVPIERMPNKNIKVGDQFRVKDDVHGIPLVVTQITETHVTLDANHPLAGMDLTFDVELTEVRDATEEEISHGHAHGPGGHHH